MERQPQVEETEHEVMLFGGEVLFVRILAADSKRGYNTVYPRLRVATTPRLEQFNNKRRFVSIRGRKYAYEGFYLRVNGKWDQVYRTYGGGLYNEAGQELQRASTIPGKVGGFVTDTLDMFVDMVPDWEVRSLILKQQDAMADATNKKERLKGLIKEQDDLYTVAWHEVHDTLNKRLIR